MLLYADSLASTTMRLQNRLLYTRTSRGDCTQASKGHIARHTTSVIRCLTVWESAHVCIEAVSEPSHTIGRAELLQLAFRHASVADHASRQRAAVDDSLQIGINQLLR